MIGADRKIVLNSWLTILVIIFLGFSAYSFVLGSPFKTLDDNISIVYNPSIKSFSHLKSIFATSFFGSGHYYRPLVSFSFMAGYAFFGLNPFYFNLTNILIHAATSCVIFFLVTALMNNRLIAFLTAVLFVIHPINWEAVCNISGRAILLSAFFAVSAFFCYVLFYRRKSIVFYICSIVFFALALLSKESAAMLPLVILDRKSTR